MVLGAKRLRVKNRGETTIEAKRPGAKRPVCVGVGVGGGGGCGGTSWERNVLLPLKSAKSPK